MSKISEKLNVEYVPVGELKPWDKNPKQLSPHDRQRLIEQIKKHGVYKPIIIDQHGTIIGGNSRYAVLVELGATHISAVRREFVDDGERVEIALSDNDQAGRYVEDQLTALVQTHDVDGSIYSVDLDDSQTIEELVGPGDDEFGDDFALDDGDKSPFQQMTFTFSDEQASFIKDMIDQIKPDVTPEDDDTFGNKNANGNALHRIVRLWAEQNQ